MVTPVKIEFVSSNKIRGDFFGKGTDTRPSTWRGCVVGNGSTFYDFDNKKLEIFDEDSGTWKEQ